MPKALLCPVCMRHGEHWLGVLRVSQVSENHSALKTWNPGMFVVARDKDIVLVGWQHIMYG